MDERFEKLVETATAGLKDDPELRLDVRAELAAHLEDAVQAFQAEGKSEAESLDMAERTFGSPVELADKLLEANRRRMRLRALARLAVRALLVPLAVVLAVWCGYGNLARVMKNYKFVTGPLYIGELEIHFPEFHGWESTEKQRDDESRELFLHKTKGIESATGNPELVELWREFRHSSKGKIFFGYNVNYINTPNHPTVTREIIRKTKQDVWGLERHSRLESYNQLLKDFETYSQLIRSGKAIDPDNALYWYKQADAYLKRAIQTREQQSFHPTASIRDSISDTDLLDQGIREFSLALEKPVLHRYHEEMMRMRWSYFSPPRLTEDYLQREVLSLSELLPEYARYRNLARAIPGCIRYLLAHRRKDEALPLLKAYYRLPEQLIGDSHSLIDYMAAAHIAQDLGKSTAEIYDGLGQHAEANEIREKTRELKSVVEKLMGPPKLDTHPLPPADGTILMSSWWGDTGIKRFMQPEDTIPLRRHEQTMAEEFTLNIIIICIFIFMLAFSVSYLVYLLRHKEGGVPLLLLPTWAITVRHVLLGIILPLFCYTLYSHLPVISGREQSLLMIWPRFLVEMVILSSGIIYLSTRMAVKQIHKRCRVLGISPDQQANTRLNRPRYWATIARSLLPVYALALIILAGFVQPVLIREETRWLQEDRIFFSGRGDVLFPLSARVITKLRPQMLKLFAEMEKIEKSRD